MRRLTSALRFGLLNSIVLCLAVITMRGLNEGWSNIRISNPPVPEVVFYLTLAVIQTVSGWLLIPADPAPGKAPLHEL